MRTLLKKIIPVIFIIILFGCGPVGLINILDISVSLKYEVEHPRAMGLDTFDIGELENYYNRMLVVFWTMMILGPVSAIAIIVRKFRVDKTRG